MRRPAWLMVPLLLLAGCITIRKIYFDHPNESCEAGRGDDCWQIGEVWLHKASWSYRRDWDLPIDKDKARAAYLRGCELNSLRACAGLLERHLLDDQAQKRDEIQARLDAAGAVLRTDEEVKQEDDLIQEASLEAESRQNEAQRQRMANALANGAVTLNQGLQQLGGRIDQMQAQKAAREAEQRRRLSSQSPASGKASSLPPTRTKAAPNQISQCAQLHQSCAGKRCCEYPNSGGWTLSCQGSQCCVPSQNACEQDTDCCEAPTLTCGVSNGMRVCCVQSGLPMPNGEAAKCCSRAGAPPNYDKCL